MSRKRGFWDDVHQRSAAKGEPFFVLAPMADVTDVPFRGIIAQIGRPDVFYTEFVSAHGLNSPGREKLIRDLGITSEDHPIVAQFFGTEPEHFHMAGVLARERGFDGVDINMGCPDRSVIKQGAGIALAKDPARAQACIAALRQGSADLPVSVKTRLGLYRTDEMDAWLGALLEARPDVLIVHGRTMKEMSKVPTHWDLLARAAEMAACADVLFVGNGDVTSRARGIELFHAWGVPGVMVGRGIFQDPWLFNPKGSAENTSPEHRIRLALAHTRAWTDYWGDFKSFHLMRKFFKVYISDWPGAAHLRAALMETHTPTEATTLLEAVLSRGVDFS